MDKSVQQEAAEALDKCIKLIDAMTPGVRYIALQDYALLNEAPIAAKHVLEKLRSVPETPPWDSFMQSKMEHKIEQLTAAKSTFERRINTLITERDHAEQTVRDLTLQLQRNNRVIAELLSRGGKL